MSKQKLTNQELQELLNLEVDSYDHDNLTIRGYFKLLLTELWTQGECFSGKRPLGDSGWWNDLYTPLVKSGAIDGNVDEDGCIDEYDEDAANELVLELISECFK